MNYLNSNQSYYRTATKIGVRPQAGTRKAISFPIDTAIWKAVGKIMLVVLPLVLVINISFSSAVSSLERSISLQTEKYQQVEDLNIDLLAQKARVWAPSNVEKLAAERLSLYKPRENQVGTFDRKLRTFTYN